MAEQSRPAVNPNPVYPVQVTQPEPCCLKPNTHGRLSSCVCVCVCLGACSGAGSRCVWGRRRCRVELLPRGENQPVNSPPWIGRLLLVSHRLCVQVRTPMVTKAHVLSWLKSEPPLLLWLPTLYRLFISQSIRHGVRCHACKTTPIAGLR